MKKILLTILAMGAPVYLMKLYEQTLASWLLTAGLDVRYNEWGY
jgi:hypothetical protein